MIEKIDTPCAIESRDPLKTFTDFTRNVKGANKMRIAVIDNNSPTDDVCRYLTNRTRCVDVLIVRLGLMSLSENIYRTRYPSNIFSNAA